VLNAATGKNERIGRLLKMHADKREEISEVGPATSPPRWACGDVTGRHDLRPKRPVLLEAMSSPSR
jgi:elongation factor G